jgi:hypothetical protein
LEKEYEDVVCAAVGDDQVCLSAAIFAGSGKCPRPGRAARLFLPGTQAIRRKLLKTLGEGDPKKS